MAPGTQTRDDTGMQSEHRLRRPLDRALIGGVCAGAADALHIDPLFARAAMLLVVAAGGAGFVLYPIAWALIPAEGTGTQTWRSRLVRWREAAAIAVLTAIAVFTLRRFGLWMGGALWAVVLASIGLALILRQLLAHPGQWPGAGRRPLAARWRRWPAAIGVMLVAAAAVLFLTAAGILPQNRKALAETAVVVIALSLIGAPFLLALARGLSIERAERIRSEERAELAAHLHDSVLQTLALIQRRAEDPAGVVTLARAQERDLRDWLLARQNGDQSTLRAALERAAEEVEARHAVQVEVVSVGDCPLDEHLRGLVAAAREALVNAAKFAGVPRVDLYAEVGEGRVEVFVRDRGAGFDPASIPPDRQGIRHSITDRMARHGGQATLRTAPGEGTEVELTMEHATA